MAGLTSSTIGRKYAMALSAIFLLIFLVMHLAVNLLSVFGETAYNNASQFMGYNPLIQFIMQPVLIFAVIYHFVMGFVLEIKNKKARPINYAMNRGSDNSSWSSRNMILSGAVILAFLVLHMYDFWFHEMNYKYVNGLPIEESRFWGDLHAKFADVWRVVLYVISFVLLGLHLSHGFQSSFQSLGARHPKYMPMLRRVSIWYSILIPLGFIFIAIYHFITQ
ncbi:succinate dehydrogenase cytochrome b subunit [Chryseobacterium camelliae]|uniref:succinate dehydrogenase cytochrome b subunit n=1 Tax=Chryseobacterium camelliae TaxID=1265445 RepID=UPI000C1CB6EA|nr:succinate dehydrogenase cytochrome b subunit [Chryseobacterium camelliae]MDR6516630.1 succinate dehydrogenase / fumarate reductase cytochrome b subunit [Chryseobacterium camelliae]